MNKYLLLLFTIISGTIYAKAGEMKIIPMSFAKGILFTSADAPVAGGENRPVIIKLTGKCYLPGKKQRWVDMNGAMVMAYTEGDWTSEKVLLKLVKLTYYDFKNQPHDIDVNGYVTTKDGEYGIKGEITTKQRKAFIASTLFALLDSTAKVLQSTTSLLSADNTVNTTGTVIQQSAGAAFARMSQYYLNVMSKLTPQIKLKNGQEVIVVFYDTFNFVSDNISD